MNLLKKTHKLSFSPSVMDFIEDIKRLSQVFLVGGVVRDYLLDEFISFDIDVELSPSMRVHNLLITKYHATFNHYGVYKIKIGLFKIECSYPREDDYPNNAPSRHEFSCTVLLATHKDPFKRDSSKRRDLSLNAIYYDVEIQKLIDPQNGLKDLESKILKAQDVKFFLLDPVRLLRLARYMTLFSHFTLCPLFEKDLRERLTQKKIQFSLTAFQLELSKSSHAFHFLDSLLFLFDKKKTAQPLSSYKEGHLFTYKEVMSIIHIWPDPLYSHFLQEYITHCPYTVIRQSPQKDLTLRLFDHLLMKNFSNEFTQKVIFFFQLYHQIHKHNLLKIWDESSQLVKVNLSLDPRLRASHLREQRLLYMKNKLFG